MHFHVYVPQDVCRPAPGVLLGYKLPKTYVVIQRVDSAVVPLDLDPDLQVIGYLNRESELSDVKSGSADSERVDASSPADVLHLRYEKSNRRLVCNTDDTNTYTLVFFSPPNLRNLEYFTVRPILLQSTGPSGAGPTLMDKIAAASTKSTSTVSLTQDSVLEKVNRCQKVRTLLSARQSSRTPATYIYSGARRVKVAVELLFLRLIYTVVTWILGFTVPLINALNHNFHGIQPVRVSAWCKQCDLRLRQISYFPIQFLCFYDTSIMSSNFLEELELPLFNLHHNINNSNYINLYNSIWLIVNDVLVGTTVYRLYSVSKGNIASLNSGLGELAFSRLGELVAWVGSDHPGGFKLNNELGQFLESLFMWTLEAWKTVFQSLMKVAASDLWVAKVFHWWVVVSCCCGVSFALAALIDYINLVTLHVYYFNMATTKIFHRQVEMLKSLTQLFRGKKYNVLRNRIDNLDDDQFHVDQLLLGTFIFMILIYLLPTTFAFYLLFFCSRVMILTGLKLGEKCIVVLNLYPLFVLLLKLKNSRRLQGGIYFEAHGSLNNCNWLTMENKALTFDEIFGNFVAVFRQEGRFKRFAMNFVEGMDIAVKDTRSMKFHYLMLPGNYDKLVDVWRSTNVLGYH